MNARVAAGGRKICEFAAYLGARFGCQHAIAIGRDTVSQLVSLPSGLEVIGVDPEAGLASAPPAADATASPAGSRSSLGPPVIPEGVLQRAVIVGAEVFGDWSGGRDTIPPTEREDGTPTTTTSRRDMCSGGLHLRRAASRRDRSTERS